MQKRFPLRKLPWHSALGVLRRALRRNSQRAALPSLSLPPELDREVQTLMRQGKEAEAIRRVAARSGAGLRRSQEYVKHLVRRR